MGTLRAFSLHLHRLSNYRPLLLDATAFGPRRLPRTWGAFSSPQPLCLCLRAYPACDWPLSFFCFQASRPPPHLLPAPVLFPRPQHRTRRRLVGKPTFLTHFLVSTPNPALKLSSVRTSLDSFVFLLHLLDLTHAGRHLALLSRQIASFAIPPHLPLPLSLIKLWVRCLTFLVSLLLRAVVVGGVGRVGRAALVARLRVHRLDFISLKPWSWIGRATGTTDEKRWTFGFVVVGALYPCCRSRSRSNDRGGKDSGQVPR